MHLWLRLWQFHQCTSGRRCTLYRNPGQKTSGPRKGRPQISPRWPAPSRVWRVSLLEVGLFFFQSDRQSRRRELEWVLSTGSWWKLSMIPHLMLLVSSFPPTVSRPPSVMANRSRFPLLQLWVSLKTEIFKN